MSTPIEIATQLQNTFDQLCQTFVLLQSEEIDTGRMANQWSPKALMSHIAFWDRAQTKRMQQLMTTGSAESVHKTWVDNDQRAAEDASRLWDEILAEAESARKEMIDFVGSLSPQDFETEFADAERTLSPRKLFEHMVRHTRAHRQEVWEYCGSMARWSRPALRRFVVQQYTNLMDSVGGLDEATILATKVCGAWSMRDVLTHVLGWNEFEYRALKGWPQPNLAALAEWQFRENDSIDAMNARLLDARSTLDMIAIVDWLTTYHRKVLKVFDNASDEMLSTPAHIGWSKPIAMSNLIYDMALHGLEHAEDIWRWKAEQWSQ